MKKTFLLPILICSLAAACSAHPVWKEEIRKVLHFKEPASTSKKILVDNISGSIDVVGYDGDEVQLVVHKTIEAESERRLEEAKEKVRVDITEEEDRVLLYVDAPWRCKDGSTNFRGTEYYGFDVQCDFELKIPKKSNVTLKTVNDGRISVRAVDGDFIVHNVNGEIEMADIGGSGDASTVNGDVTVHFKSNPTESSSFKTVNGKVDIAFRDNLSADLRLKTFNGEAYSDFAMEPLPSKAFEVKHSKHRNVYRIGEFALVRVGKGGPELSFDTLNGNIYIARNEGNARTNHDE